MIYLALGLLAGRAAQALQPALHIADAQAQAVQLVVQVVARRHPSPLQGELYVDSARSPQIAAIATHYWHLIACGLSNRVGDFRIPALLQPGFNIR